MAVLGSYRRIFKQDYSEAIQEDIDTLSISLNDSFETIYDALTNQVTFSDNINCTITTFNATVDNNFAPVSPVVLKLNDFQKKVIGILPIRVVANNNNTTLPDAGVYLDYTINNNTTSSANTTNTGNASNSPFTININYIKGLPVNTSFSITAIII